MKHKNWAQYITRHVICRMLTLQNAAAYLLAQQGAHKVAQKYASVLVREELLKGATEGQALKTACAAGMRFHKMIKAPIRKP